MTNYADPVTATEVCERIREGLEYQVQKLRRDAEILLAKADAIDQASRDVVFNEKRLYEQYQPRDSGHAETPEDPDENGSSCTGDPCTCANGIGCVNIPVDQW